MSPEALSVSEVLALAKQVLEEGTGPVWVTGELSGFKRHQPSGHLYFDLKDGRSRLSCVQWREQAKRLRFEPADGMLVRAHGRLGIYEVQGRLQLYVDSLEPAGLGALQAALEVLKNQLAQEGLFANERKRALPSFPQRIGVATSGTGAAVRDILRVLRERWPIAEVIVRPCAVQGEGAAGQIVEALDDLQRVKGLDLILLGRGGGSIEDLWAFNEEAVVRAVAGSNVPVVTGIGHEIDVTLADFAADLRAATPSQAAELSVPSRADVLRSIRAQAVHLRHHAGARLRTARLHLSRLEGSHGLRRPVELVRQRVQRLDGLALRLERGIAGQMDLRRRHLGELSARWRLRAPASILRRARQRLAELDRRIAGAAQRRLREAGERLRTRAAHLEAVGPRSVLARGYSICLRGENGKAVRIWHEVACGEPVRVILGQGELGCIVEERKEGWT